MAYIEVKCFPGAGDTTLFLAIPTQIWDMQFGDTYRNTILNNHVKIIVVDLETETIARWIR